MKDCDSRMIDTNGFVLSTTGECLGTLCRVNTEFPASAKSEWHRFKRWLLNHAMLLEIARPDQGREGSRTCNELRKRTVVNKGNKCCVGHFRRQDALLHFCTGNMRTTDKCYATLRAYVCCQFKCSIALNLYWKMIVVSTCSAQLWAKASVETFCWILGLDTLQ